MEANPCKKDGSWAMIRVLPVGTVFTDAPGVRCCCTWCGQTTSWHRTREGATAEWNRKNPDAAP